MSNKEDKKSKLIKFYKKLREDWKIPRKKALIKMGAYLVFFIIFFILAAISNKINNKEEFKIDQTTTNIKEDSLYSKENNLLQKKLNINYKIVSNNVEYKINGTLENNIIIGYLEYNNTIKKIIVDNNILYEVKNEENIELTTDIDFSLINISNIINLVKEKSSIIERTDDNSINYIYGLLINDKDVIIKIYSSNDNIYKIEVSNEMSKYILNFDN